MSYHLAHTEHNGPKTSCASFYGRRLEAKEDARISRRQVAQQLARAELEVWTQENSAPLLPPEPACFYRESLDDRERI
jgi:hypothetical protein